jgi:SAM-dependent methyltransferase
MRLGTAASLSCPGLEASCGGSFSVQVAEQSGSAPDILYGQLNCGSCHAQFPILAGVAILVPDVESYLHEHYKGIAKLVPDSRIPEAYAEAWMDAKKNLETESVEEDLESERVNSLYLLNHYLKANDPWWKKARLGPLFSELVEKYWDHGPFEKIKSILSADAPVSLLEMGCGVGGLYRELSGVVSQYLGVDSSFASIALARHINLGAPYAGELFAPVDLLSGSLSESIHLPLSSPPDQADQQVDFIVGDALLPPLKLGIWDASASLNMLDMIPEPENFPALHASLVKPSGLLIQSCPYLWHPESSARVRAAVPSTIRDSGEAARWLYENAGMVMEKQFVQVPWLFYKHSRQLEIFSTHVFSARKKSA